MYKLSSGNYIRLYTINSRRDIKIKTKRSTVNEELCSTAVN